MRTASLTVVVEPTGNRLILRGGVRTRRRWDLYHHGEEERRSPKTARSTVPRSKTTRGRLISVAGTRLTDRGSDL